MTIVADAGILSPNRAVVRVSALPSIPVRQDFLRRSAWWHSPAAAGGNAETYSASGAVNPGRRAMTGLIVDLYV